MFAGLAAVLLLLGGCSAGNPDVQVYYTPESQSFESKFYPAAVPAEAPPAPERKVSKANIDILVDDE